MTRAALILAALASTVPGCIYYEGNGDCPTCGWNDDDFVDDTDDTATPAADFTLRVDPSEIAQGESVIATITVEEGEADLSNAVTVRSFGSATIGAVQARTDEILLSISIDHDAALGAFDVMVEFADGTAVYLDGAITVTEAIDDGSGSGGDGGSGTGGDCP